MSKEDIKIIVTNIQVDISTEMGKASTAPKNQPSLANLREYFHQKYPTESEQQIMARVLAFMKEQFFSSFPSQPSREENHSMKTSSSQGSLDSNTYNCLAGESQAEESVQETDSVQEEPSLEDFWDALVQFAAPQGQQSNNFGKGKNPQN